MQQRFAVALLLLAALVVAAVVTPWQPAPPSPNNGAPVAVPPPPPVANNQPLTDVEILGVENLCRSCHALPRPSSFAKDRWRQIAEEWYDYAGKHHANPERIVALDVVVRYFEQAAPAQLTFTAEPQTPSQEDKLRFRKSHYRPKTLENLPRVSNVKWASLRSQNGLDCIVSDMEHGVVMLWQFDHPDEGLIILSDQVRHPVHAEVVDLNRDGHHDLLVADLGTFFPDDSRNGRVVYLRYNPVTSQYDALTLAEDIGRVADVQATDFDGDGDDDLIVASFGWREVGKILYLANRTLPGAAPSFVPIEADPRHGAIHVPIADLNRDGRPDFVALLSQGFEEIVAYINVGPGKFSTSTLYAANDPAYGSTGIQLVDMDGDHDLDVLYTNGDLMDSGLLKPYHSVQWLENDGAFPFTRHHLAAMPGVHRAVAADMDGDGDQDVVATAFVPDTAFMEREQWPLKSILWIEQVAQRKFVARTIETVFCDYPTADLADYDRDGDVDLVTGTMTWKGLKGIRTPGTKAGSITIWTNQSAPQPVRAATP